MLRLKHEGFDCTLENISRYKATTNHRYIILCLLDGEIDQIFTTDGSIDKAKADIKEYYAFVLGSDCYSCVAYIKH